MSEDGYWQWDAEANDWTPVQQSGETAGGGDTDAQGGTEVKADEVANMMEAAEQQAGEA
ncbi:MAG: hypothetical protein ACRD0A_00560 [Acidimicrobiales bacterium]